ncbi:hypothetical protein [Pseudomonas sp. G5(2012)]|uniref:hypothetical protein n=1 Tax=Pseudomonas sp. G5(2012) TaxID=1268068 RepID=UPI0003432562|nr:hypothetical protein [Pseudomonas sp. G5(2012)]EPA95531.1 hypothetical protein PG5_40420 [Pseudomonas sp. G5(2012)]
MAGPGRPPGLPKTGGRVKKSLDKQQRQLVSAELAHSILATFEMLGGTAAMVEWAADNKSVFYTQILSRLMPAPQRDDPEVQINQQFNIDTMSDLEAGRRVAFALAKAAHDQGIDTTPVETIEVTPQQACSWQNPTPPYTQHPEAPVDDPDRAKWASELSLSPQERVDQALVRETRECTLQNYRGGPGEQGGYAPDRSPASTRKPTVAEIRRKQLL